MSKTILMILILVVVCVFGAVFYLKMVEPPKVESSPVVQAKIIPTDTPTPTPNLINESSVLSEELNNLTPPDYKADFDQLNQQISQY